MILLLYSYKDYCIYRYNNDVPIIVFDSQCQCVLLETDKNSILNRYKGRQSASYVEPGEYSFEGAST